MFPDKPIKYLVNTHHHSDHAGGIRAYVAEDIPIMTHESHKRYYEQEIFKNPHTLNPDRLARMPRAPIIETVKDKRVLTDGNMTLEVHLLRGNFHAEGLLAAYIPKEKLLVQADAFIPRPGVPPLPTPSPYTINLVENVERLKLKLTRGVPSGNLIDVIMPLVATTLPGFAHKKIGPTATIFLPSISTSAFSKPPTWASILSTMPPFNPRPELKPAIAVARKRTWRCCRWTCPLQASGPRRGQRLGRRPRRRRCIGDS
jgi:hypothetical protein